jgi:excisionase family DNA binding protein
LGLKHYMLIELDDKDIERVANKVLEVLQGQMLNPSSLLSPEELATHLNVPKSWIYDRTRDNAIPHVKIGKYVRFSLPEVLAWLKTNNNKNNC